MTTNSKWILTFTGLTLAAGLAVLGFALVHMHPIYHIESLALMVNCGGDFEAHAAWTEQQHVRQYPVCLDRSELVESARSASQCSGGHGSDRGQESAQKEEESYSNPDALHRLRL